jgi:uncharacterized protein YndB with AHSA1/START domain
VFENPSGLPPIRWRVHLRSAPEAVYRALTTAEGRARFWAESAEQDGDVIRFRFSNGQQLDARVLEQTSPVRFRLTYFGGGVVTFDLARTDDGGTDLTVTDEVTSAEEYGHNRAGWVAVLLVLKAAIDFDVDLRSHDTSRTWEHGYVDV